MHPIYWPFLPESATTMMVTNRIFISIIPPTSISSHPTIRKSFPCSPLSIYLPICLPAYLSIHPSISVSPFLNLSLSPHTTHTYICILHIYVYIYYLKFNTLYVLIKELSSCTFKVIIDKDVLIASYFLFSGFFYSSSVFLSYSLVFFLCGLMTFFSGKPIPFSFSFVYLL